MRNPAVFFVGGLFLGALFTWIGVSPRPAVAPSQDDRVVKFVDRDVRAYGEAMSPEDKILQGDVLYRKAVQLFVADMGLPVTGLDPEAKGALPKVNENAVATVDEGDPGTTAVARPAPHPKTSGENELLARVRKLPYAKKVDPRIQKLEGKFVGTVERIAGVHRGETDQIVLEVNLKMVQGQLSGLYHVELTGPKGELISRKHHVGPNKSIRLPEDSKLKAWLDVGSTKLMHLNVGSGHGAKGDLYGPDGEKVGRVSLKKR